MKSDYVLLDCGNQEKLEQFGSYKIIRPCAQALWRPQKPEIWGKADARFTRDPENRWELFTSLPKEWTIEVAGIQFILSPTDFGHLGIFPEQDPHWQLVKKRLVGQEAHLLNLFAYSGGMSLAAAQAGAHVCHLDASKGMVDWARRNAAENGLNEAPIRWITDDVTKFIEREIRRERRYNAIVLDPPTFGRGPKGQLFKIEEDLIPLLENCQRLLSDEPLFLMLSCHTPGYTPTTLAHILKQVLGGSVESGELLLKGTNGNFDLPSGVFGVWSP